MGDALGDGMPAHPAEPHSPLARAERAAFHDPAHEARRMFAETFGTFLLVLAGAGGAVVDASQGGISRVAQVTAPALVVLAVILFMGAVSGAHLNPVVSIAFALRRDFPWSRVPGYVLAQLVGASLACVVLRALFGPLAKVGATLPGPGISDVQACAMEGLLTLGLVSTILGTASGAQNVGPMSSVGVGAYIALAGLWSSPVTGASMNVARSFAPDVVRGDFAHFWPYLVGPLVGAVAAVGVAFVLRGAGGGPTGRRSAQGAL
ncbi:MAG: aquaporin [Mycobacteriales bacterium]